MALPISTETELKELIWKIVHRTPVTDMHTHIYEAIKARDPESAYTELRNHILTVKKVMKPSPHKNAHL